MIHSLTHKNYIVLTVEKVYKESDLNIEKWAIVIVINVTITDGGNGDVML